MGIKFQDEYSDSFVGYEPTSIDPGSYLTTLTISVCVLSNLALPFMVRYGRRRKREQEEKEHAALLNQGTDKNGDMEPTNDRQSAVSGHSHYNDAKSDVGSVFSGMMESVCNARGHMNHKHTRRHRHHVKTVDAGTSPVPVPFAKPMAGKSTKDDQSVVSASVLSSLDDAAVDANDAASAAADAHMQHHLAINLNVRKPSFVEKTMEIVDWDADTSRIFKLFLPYSLQGAVTSVFGIISIALIGFHIGVQAANVSIIMGILWSFTDTLTYGFRDAIGVLAPQASGAKKPELVGRYLQLSILFYSIFAIPSIVIWGFFTSDVVYWFGYDEETARFAQRYAYPYLAGYILGGLDSCMYEFLDVMGYEKYATIVSVLDAAIETLITLLMVTVGTKDLIHLAYVQVAWGFLFSAANFGFVVFKGWLDPYWEGLAKSSGLKDRKALETLLKTAIPLSLAYILTYGEWEVLTIFARYMGPAEVAAWGLLGYLWEAFENFISALSSATEVRVGFQMGAGLPAMAKVSAHKSMYLGSMLAILSTAILFIIAEDLPSLLTPDPILQRMIFDTLPLIGFGQISMAVGNVCWGVLEGQGRVRMATLVEVVASWFVVIPLSALFVYGLNYNLIGIISALVFGYTVAGLWIGYLIFTGNWGSLSKIVMERHGSTALPYSDQDWNRLPEGIQRAASMIGYNEYLWDSKGRPGSMATRTWNELSMIERDAAKSLGYSKGLWEGNSDSDDSSSGSSTEDEPVSKYEDFDWDELPEEARKAAAILGYTKAIWDNDGDASCSNKYWKKLSPEEQEAAKVLGYKESSWDDGSESSSSSNAKPSLL